MMSNEASNRYLPVFTDSSDEDDVPYLPTERAEPGLRFSDSLFAGRNFDGPMIERLIRRLSLPDDFVDLDRGILFPGQDEEIPLADVGGMPVEYRTSLVRVALHASTEAIAGETLSAS